jgi:hypothetical protein
LDVSHLKCFINSCTFCALFGQWLILMGIGMISEGFVANGAKVYISSRDTKACDKAVKELNALGTFPLVETYPTTYLTPSQAKEQPTQSPPISTKLKTANEW